ncbi:MAG TPA: hypothetical protein VNL71_15645, partial [Chloroflexota bacterium]|nr:hypothetical protein [Chloroflexota bacterium]
MPITPGYYRPREDDGDLPAGTRVYATGTEGDQVRFLRHNLSYHTPLARFLALYEEFSGGAVDYQREVAEHLQHTHQANERLTAQIAAAANVQPHLGSAGSLLGTGDLEPGHATNESSHLPLASGESGAISAKRLAAQLRNTLAKATVTLKARQEALARVLAEQTAILSERMRTLAELTATAKEAIWTINIYLGADEEIVRLAAGEPAGAATPISVRQLVLYMDEECGLRAGDGGLDARMIEQFDAWILADPTHLAQILPEPKGLVALKPRRRRRDYDDPWLAKTMEEENKKTYFLLRNGENLYRLCTSYEVGEIVVPREQEFANLFLEKTHRYRPDGTLAWETVPMQPGSQAYMRAEKAASARTRHYFRMALLLQGLLDRTTVFRPIARAILVTNPAQSDGLLH